MKKTKAMIYAGLLLIATGFICGAAAADTYTTGPMTLTKPARASVNWDGKINGNFDIIAASVAVLHSTQTFTAPQTISNTLSVTGNAFSVGGSTLVVANGRVGVGKSPDYPLEAYNSTASTFSANAISITANPANIAGYGNGILFNNGIAAANTFHSGRIYSVFDGANYNEGRISIQTPLGLNDWHNTLNIKNSRVGINTTTPGSTLHVNGDATISTSLTASSVTATTSIWAQNGVIRAEEPDAVSGIKMGQFVQSNAGQDRALAVEYSGGVFGLQGYNAAMDSARNMWLQANGGNVGIGITAPETPLHIKAANGYATIRLSDASNSADIFHNSGTDDLEFKNLSSYADSGFKFYTNTTNQVVTIQKGGNVGIGDISPSYPLDIDNTSEIAISFYRLTAGGKEWGFTSGTTGMSVYNITDNTTPMYILNSGNIIFGDSSETAGKGWAKDGSRGVYLTNYSGNTISSGTIVQPSAAYNYTLGFTTSTAQSEGPIGTLMDDSCVANAVCRICTEGICPVKLDSNEACAITDLVIVTGDQVGRADCLPDTTSRHNGEVGQPLQFTTSATGPVIWMQAHRN